MLSKDQANLTYDKIAYARDTGLVQRGIVSQDTVDSAKSALDQALAQIEVDKAIIRQDEAALDSALVNLGYTNIISPVDGTVVSRSVTIGQTVAASFQTPTLFLIATDLTQMEVDTNVSESDVGGLREGDQATFVVEAYPNRSFAGKVMQFRQAPQTVQNVVTYDVVIGVRNDERLLEPGMTATARIITERRDDVLRVPDQALRFAPSGLPGASSTVGGSAGVWLLQAGRPMRRAIKTGLDDDSLRGGSRRRASRGRPRDHRRAAPARVRRCRPAAYGRIRSKPRPPCPRPSSKSKASRGSTGSATSRCVRSTA